MSTPDHQDQDYRISPPPAEKTHNTRRTYRVVYEIDVLAASPKDAAGQVYDIFRDPEALPPAFLVLDSDGRQTVVDLYAEGLEERYGPTVDIIRVDGGDENPAPGQTPA